ncbi:pyruvate phosphate dikinase [Aneurinibacillus thermoaerophilus]|uniref:Pyruvate, phosphate dikinase n=1 Tax=Aneurinibacillus thermoaerophilus TaxID=143495 RepID=A0A1G8AG29_ANETH|nr:pyruvate, phosphate dikinase [Aneurinibacillus thermoaerophilus]SDH19796.1 pyruvate phosphate dikinase [Aneurinibacillus thermoaerophilus]
MMSKKYVYLFHEGNATMNDLLGRKGANLAEMTGLGLPVPPGFTITTSACRRFYEEGKNIHPEIEQEIYWALHTLEETAGKRFGHPSSPLLVSVRSGSSISMPGMMDTILNLGLNDYTVAALAAHKENKRFAYDSYRRFIQMFSSIVLGVDERQFEDELERIKKQAGVEQDSQLSCDHLLDLILIFKEIVFKETGHKFPQDPKQQLITAIGAVFDSWYNQRAMIYRRIQKIPEYIGTAVTIQQMVFGNLGPNSGTGIAFTRHPSTGENELFGEFMFNAQGEDIVAGIRTPQQLTVLQERLPETFEQFKEIAYNLEKHYRDVQDIEFTVEEGKLYILQTRSAKRTAEANIKIAVDMANEGLITREEAIMRVDPASLAPLMQYTIDPNAELNIIGKGLDASSGAATGIIVFDAEEAERQHRTGHSVILVRQETTPEDIHGILASAGVLTTRGGVTSHAAVVARDLGTPSVVGCESFTVDMERRELHTGTVILKEGDVITICGSTGRVILGEVPLVPPKFSKEFCTLLEWTNEYKTLAVYSSVNTPQEAKLARKMGAEGVGLCRTELMFMDPERLPRVTRMILARTSRERKKALQQLIPLQKSDFIGIFRAMEGKQVTIRLIDPPLHEFLPHPTTVALEIERARLAGDEELLAEKEALQQRIEMLHELNPSFGHRGCRIGITYPEIYEVQTRAIAEAALELKAEGMTVYPNIIVPLVSDWREMKAVRETVEETLEQVFSVYRDRIDIPIGAFIELPRACITADKMVEYADFITFGTNDLTQSTYGFSRDDAEGKYLAHYLDHNILPENPFVYLDEEGVGKLIEIAIAKGRKRKPNLPIGVCGEHTSEKHSVLFLQNVGINFISSLLPRVPAARIAAAQAAIRMRRQQAINGN